MILPIPEKAGYIFTGWMTGFTINDTQFTNYIPVTKDIDLYAGWTVDTGLVEAFFAALQSDHFTINRIVDSSITNDMNTIIMDSDITVMLSAIAGGYLVHWTEAGLTSVPGIISIAVQRESYELYLGSNGDEGLTLYLFQYDEQNGWDVSTTSAVLAIDIDLDMFDPSLFVKREEGLLYDYPATPALVAAFFDQVFGQFGMELPYELNATLLTCVLNLETDQLTIEMSGLVEILDYSQSEFDIRIEFNLRDVGTTSVVLPFADIKADLVESLSEAINQVKSSWDYDAATPETREGFDVLAVEALACLAPLDTPDALVDAFLLQMNSIIMHSFEIDYLRLEQETAANSMLSLLDTYRACSTTESILLMENAYDDYLVLVFSATTEDELIPLVEEYEAALLLLREIDLIKLDVATYRQILENELMMYSNLIDFISSEEERTVFFELLAQSIETMNLAGDMASLDAAYEAAYASFLAADFTMESPIPLLNILTFELEAHFQSLMAYAGDHLEELSLLHQSLVESLGQETSPLLMLYRYHETVHELHAFVLPFLLPDRSASIDLMVADYGPSLSPDTLTRLQNGSTWTKTLLESAVTVEAMDAYVENFQFFASNLPVDPWLAALVEATTDIDSFRAEQALTATPESVFMMQAAVDDFLIARDLLADEDFLALELLVQETRNLIQLRYVLDPAWVPILEARASAVNELTLFYEAGLVYLDPEGVDGVGLHGIFESHLTLIGSSESPAEIETLLAAAKTDLVNYAISYLPYESLGIELANQLFLMYDSWYSDYDIEGFDVVPYLDVFDMSFTYSINPYDALLQYEYVKEELFDGLLATMRDRAVNQVMDLYSNYQILIDPSGLDELDNLLNACLEAVDATVDFSLFDELVAAFIADCDLLP